MRTILFALTLIALVRTSPAARADDYALDDAHTAVTFKISHLGLSWTYGRFNEATGAFTINADPTKSSFALNIKATSIDTNNKKRDEHLSSPDFFNVKQFPTIAFQSTAVKPIADGLEVTGNLTLHGVTKPVTFNLIGGRKAEFPKGMMRTGYSAELKIKRTDFGMNKLVEAVGDEVYIAISFEGVKK